jgi:hypothetical protein
VDHAVPGVACVVDDDVDFTVAEVCGLLDQRVEVFVVEHVSWSGDCLTATLVDGVCDALCFVCGGMSVTMSQALWFQKLYHHIFRDILIQGMTDRHRYR